MSWRETLENFGGNSTNRAHTINKECPNIINKESYGFSAGNKDFSYSNLKSDCGKPTFAWNLGSKLPALCQVKDFERSYHCVFTESFFWKLEPRILGQTRSDLDQPWHEGFALW